MHYTIPPNQEQHFDTDLIRQISESFGLKCWIRHYCIDGAIVWISPGMSRKDDMAAKHNLAQCMQALYDAGFSSQSNPFSTIYRHFVLAPFRQTVKAQKLRDKIIKNQIRGMIRRTATFRSKTEQTQNDTGVSFEAELAQIDQLAQSLRDRLESF